MTPCDIDDLGLNDTVILREEALVQFRAKVGQSQALS